MIQRWLRVASLVFLSLLFLGGPLHAEQTIDLQNGLIRLSFDQHTGFFEVHSLKTPKSSLFQAGPSLIIGNTRLSPTQATKLEFTRQPFEDNLGKGEKLTIRYFFRKEAFHIRYEIALYSQNPWVSIVAYLPKGNYHLNDLTLIQGKIRSSNAYRSRVYVSSGTAGGDSGVWPLGVNQRTSSTLSVVYDPATHAAIGLGFYSFYRASTSVMSQYMGPNEIGVDAVAHYYGYQPKDKELKSESILLNFNTDPLKLLDGWIDAATETTHPIFNHDTRRGFLNSWYIYGDRITADDIVHQADLLRRSILPGYGITSVFLGEWQYQRPQYGDVGDNYGIGEDKTDPRLFPQGIQWLADKISADGLYPVFGANYAYAAPHSKLAQEHQPWVHSEDYGGISYGYPIDFTDPSARQWLSKLARRTGDYKAVEWWDDFDGGPSRGVLHDSSQIMQFEDIRDGLKTIRQAIGSHVTIHRFCCGPYFSYWGLADRVRIGRDAPALGDWDGFKTMARELASAYMLHQRAWINDPDPLFVGGRYNQDPFAPSLGADPSLLPEVRMRLQEQLISGGPMTIGENLEDFDAERFHLLTLVLPIYGQSARPLDLFVHSVPEIYDLNIKKNWDSWHVLIIQNWNEDRRHYNIPFVSMSLDPNRNYLVFRFWDQKLLGIFHGEFVTDVNGEEGETYAVRRLPSHPAILSDDMHLTQGAVELGQVQYNESSEKLSGTASRNPGAVAHLAIYVPKGYSIRSVSGPYRADNQPSGATVVYLEIKFGKKTEPWSISFSHTP
jgi:hypothetical protein